MKLELARIPHAERAAYKEILLLADDWEEAVDGYIQEGELFAAKSNGEIIGACLMIPVSAEEVEIKNIAILPGHQGKGWGKALIEQVCNFYRELGLQRITVGTANSSIENLAFYQKAGFRMVSIRRDFFAAYPEPIFENGIRALDMVMFERIL